MCVCNGISPGVGRAHTTTNINKCRKRKGEKQQWEAGASNSIIGGGVRFPRRDRANNRSPGVRADVNKLKFLPSAFRFLYMAEIGVENVIITIVFYTKRRRTACFSNDGLVGLGGGGDFLWIYPKGAVNVYVYISLALYILYILYLYFARKFLTLYSTQYAYIEFEKIIHIKHNIIQAAVCV